ncbi:MAG: hypothetical protein IH828_10580 [Nitrospinae bacterium]|nr:hypothetical protein [Nitrospinota bacterium]MCH7769355.1 hypothetical protein [Nitrospinota bacterium]
MNMPPPGVIRNPGPNLYETLYKPFDGPPYFLTSDVELPKHVQKIVGENPHLQPGLVGLEEGRIDSEKIGVVTFLLASSYLVNSFTDYLHREGSLLW